MQDALALPCVRSPYACGEAPSISMHRIPVREATQSSLAHKDGKVFEAATAKQVEFCNVIAVSSGARLPARLRLYTVAAITIRFLITVILCVSEIWTIGLLRWWVRLAAVDRQYMHEATSVAHAACSGYTGELSSHTTGTMPSLHHGTPTTPHLYYDIAP